MENVLITNTHIIQNEKNRNFKSIKDPDNKNFLKVMLTPVTSFSKASLLSPKKEEEIPKLFDKGIENDQNAFNHHQRIMLEYNTSFKKTSLKKKRRAKNDIYSRGKKWTYRRDADLDKKREDKFRMMKNREVSKRRARSRKEKKIKKRQRRKVKRGDKEPGKLKITIPVPFSLSGHVSPKYRSKTTRIQKKSFLTRGERNSKNLSLTDKKKKGGMEITKSYNNISKTLRNLKSGLYTANTRQSTRRLISESPRVIVKMKNMKVKDIKNLKDETFEDHKNLEKIRLKVKKLKLEIPNFI